MNALERCYDKHPFAELNTIDCGLFVNVLSFLFGKGLPQNPVFFDVGCNSGSFVNVLNANRITTDIHTFEPHPVLARTTKSKYPHIRMNEICISNSDGLVDVYLPELSSGLGSIIDRPIFKQLNQEITKLTVPSKTLDSYCLENNINTIDFIKIDVEGAEKYVFEGAKTLLSKKRIKSGMFEVGSTLTDAGTSSEEIVELLESYGYTIYTNFSPNDYVFIS